MPNYTEFQWNIKVRSPATLSDIYQFRVYAGSTALDTYAVTPQVTVEASAAITQAAYRFYDETGTESASVALAAQDTALSAGLTGPDGFGHLRIRLQNTNASAIPATDDFTLQWEKNASGTWTNVGTGAVVGYNSPNLTEGEATTNRLGAGTGSFVAGKASEDGVVDNLGWTASNYTEVVYSCRLVASQLAHGDTLRFRVLKNGATTDMTYTVTPTINLTVPAFGQSVRFDASTDYYTGPTMGAVSDFTMCCWVYPVTTTANHTPLAFAVPVSLSAYQLLNVSINGEAGYWNQSGTTTAVSPIIPDNSWAFIAVSSTATGKTLYMARLEDNTLISMTAVAGTTTTMNASSALRIGIMDPSPTTQPFNGRVAAVKIWTAALTEAELALERQLNRSVARTANLWAFYSFTQGPSTYDNAEIGGRGLTAVGALTAEPGPPDILITANAGHTLISDNVVLTQVHPPLVVADATHTLVSGNVVLVPVVAAFPIQEGFRWRNDDGTQVTATWKAAQDTNTSVALDTPVRLRVLLDTTVNPAPFAPTLYYKKTTDSTWMPVPVGSGGGGSYSHFWTGTDPATTGADTTAYELGTYFNLLSPQTLQGIRIWNPGLVNTATAHTQNRVATLWTTTNTSGAGGVTQRTIDLPDLMPAGWSEHLFSTPYSATTGVQYCIAYFVHGSGSNADYGATGFTGYPFTAGPIEVQDGRFRADAAPGSNPPDNGRNFYGVDLLYGTGDSPNPVYIATSANITTGGQATTAQLTAPSGKTTADFVVGRMWDDENGTDSVNI